MDNRRLRGPVARGKSLVRHLYFERLMPRVMLHFGAAPMNGHDESHRRLFCHTQTLKRYLQLHELSDRDVEMRKVSGRVTAAARTLCSTSALGIARW